MEYASVVIAEVPLPTDDASGDKSSLCGSAGCVDMAAGVSVVVVSARVVAVIERPERLEGERRRTALRDRTNEGNGADGAATSAAVTQIETKNDVVGVALSRTGAYVAVADAAGLVHLFESSTGQVLFSYPIVKTGGADR
ncbi:TPA: hypothetical protein N0F65_007557 [Lagenidium giganteum]|uniref:Uncharacterized protein n=1 Tax=Lagenidium giganteum TaxID=4803 RepID=A0AAV2ZIU2_9STRA|nr:TPA: hypothetical protein N0F65_007557 [Lagenidium giganteum]